MTIGIYLFTNKINGKQYIGQSMNIEKRYNDHKTRPFKETSSAYNVSFYKAIRKYGFDNFDYKIIDSNNAYTREDLNKLEAYYIKKYDTWKKGYNETPGGDCVYIHEKISNDVKNVIIDLIENTQETFSSISNKYNVNNSLISQVNQGKIWVKPDKQYPLRKEVNKLLNKGGQNPRAKLTDEEVIKMRHRYVNETMPKIYEDYKYMSFNEIKKIIYGSQFKHLPIYRKREKQWYLNGTCIDYPRLEE